MSDIDLEKEIEDDIKNEGTKAGISLYNFDLSKLRVMIGAPIVADPTVATSQPIEASQRHYRNCSRQTRTERVQLTHTATSAYRVRLNSALRLGKTMSTQIQATPVVALGSGFNVQLDLTIDAEHSGSRGESMEIDESTLVAPCTTLKVAVLESRVNFRVDFRIPVLVTGNVTCYQKVGWPMGDPSVDWSYTKQYEVQGTAEVLGVHLSKSWEEYRANCPRGTACAARSDVKGENFWHLETWEESGDNDHDRPQRSCGDQFTVKAVGVGATKSEAAERAQRNAKAGAEHECPSECPAVRVNWFTETSVEDNGEWVCVGLATYECRSR